MFPLPTASAAPVLTWESFSEEMRTAPAFERLRPASPNSGTAGGRSVAQATRAMLLQVVDHVGAPEPERYGELFPPGAADREQDLADIARLRDTLSLILEAAGA